MTGIWSEELFTRADRVPLSKEPTRALIASLLWPLDGLTIGESGTGSGGITLEIARRVGTGHIYSCDPKEEALKTAAANLKKAGMENKVSLIKSGAPEAFKEMPPLDRLIVGGHGGNLSKILEEGIKKLTPNGRIIVTANMPTTAVVAMNKLEELKMPPEMWHVNVAKSKKIKSEWMMNAYNPTYIIWADIEEGDVR